MPATRLRQTSSRQTSSRKTSSKAALGFGISVLVAIAIASFVHILWSSPSTAVAPGYSIDPAYVALTAADVGPTFPLVNEGPLGPSQHTPPGFPLPYQQQFVGGWDRNFIVQNALVPPGGTEIETYEQAHGFSPTNPPTIFGPFVADHHGLFEVTDTEISYHTASAAHPDYLVSYPTGDETTAYETNYVNWRMYPIQLGEEA
jgi:hypothetical protein